MTPLDKETLEQRIWRMKDEAYERTTGGDGLARIDDDDVEAIKQLLKDVLDAVKPEYLELHKDESDAEWFYGRGNNAAIDDMEANQRKLGL